LLPRRTFTVLRKIILFDNLLDVRYYVHITIKHNNMNIKNIISISEARKKIFDYAEKVQKPGVYYTFTEKGRPKAVLMSAEEFESWQETLEVMRDFPELKKDIEIAEKEYQKGDYITLEEFIAKEGYVLADKSKKKYAISGRNSKKSSKRTK